MTLLFLALTAGYGTHLLWTRYALGWTGVQPGPRRRQPSDPGITATPSFQRWLRQAGLDGTSPAEFAGVSVTLAVVGAALTFSLFGSSVAAILGGLGAAAMPVATYRDRRRRRRETAQEAWPRIIEEIRILTASVGRSIPQALLEAGTRAPEELRGAFEAAQREWLITTDFARTVAVVKVRLADPTADAACETLLVAHEVGGADLDRRLEALAQDRTDDLNGRKDARARQAGVRFARRFVLIVPLGMALAGMSVGNGRAAYQTSQGQVLVAVALALVAGCWLWAGRIMAVPEESRVFDR